MSCGRLPGADALWLSLSGDGISSALSVWDPKRRPSYLRLPPPIA